jgi:hypothetical protein
VKNAGIIDTISNDTIINAIFRPYVMIKNAYIQKTFSELRRNIPTVKEIHPRNKRDKQWMFWVIVFILLYISFIRISTPNSFKTFLQSVFNLKLSEKIWDDQKSFFSFVYLQLFAIYLFIAALFICYFLQLRNIHYIQGQVLQYFTIFSILVLIYLLKFLLHGFLGLLLKMKNLAIGFVSNTISVNNFIALTVFPLLVFLIYNNHKVLQLILTQSIIAIFFISVVYRIVRMTLLRNHYFSFPIIYLFIYLCALEILPWFILIKFLNQLPV